jgi:hypothetical protein
MQTAAADRRNIRIESSAQTTATRHRRRVARSKKKGQPMKRPILIFLLSVCLALSGCGLAPATTTNTTRATTTTRTIPAELEEAFQRFEMAESLTMAVVILNIPLVGNLYGVAEMNGVYMHMEIQDQESYLMKHDGNVYELVLINGVWIPRPYVPPALQDNPFGETDEVAETDLADYQYVDGYYVYQSPLENTASLKIMVEDGFITKIIFTLDFDGVTLGVNILLSDYDATTVEHPEHVDVDRYLAARAALEETYIVSLGASSILFQGDDHNIGCNAYSCTYVDDDDSIEFDIAADQFFTYDDDHVLTVLDLDGFRAAYAPELTVADYLEMKYFYTLFFSGN